MEAALAELAVQATQVGKAFSSVTSLTDLFYAYKAIPLRWALAAHCLFCATLGNDFKDKFLVHFWVCFLAGFGGGTVSSLLLMNPVKAPIALFASNDVGVFFAIAWWLMNFFPFGLVSLAYRYSPIKYVAKLGTTLLKANLMIHRVDLAVELFPGVIAAPLLLGTIAGSGGKFVTDIIRHGWGALAGPAEASQPSVITRSAFLGTVGYYVVAHVLRVMTREEASALLITVLLVHSLASDLLGNTLTDFTYPLFRLAHAVSFVPMPGVSTVTATTAPSSSKKAAKKAAAAVAAATVTATASPPAASTATSQGTPTKSRMVPSREESQQMYGSKAPATPASATKGGSKGGNKSETKKSK